MALVTWDVVRTRTRVSVDDAPCPIVTLRCHVCACSMVFAVMRTRISSRAHVSLSLAKSSTTHRQGTALRASTHHQAGGNGECPDAAMLANRAPRSPCHSRVTLHDGGYVALTLTSGFVKGAPKQDTGGHRGTQTACFHFYTSLNRATLSGSVKTTIPSKTEN